MTAWRGTPGEVTAHPEIIQLQAFPPRIWTPASFATPAGDRPRSANTPPGTWRTPNVKTWAKIHGELVQLSRMNLRGTPRPWSRLRDLTLAVEMMCLLLRVLQVGVEPPLLQTKAVQAGEMEPTATKHLLEQAAGATLQQEVKTLICPKMELLLG